MKRIFIILSIFIMILGIAGCSGTSSVNSNNTPNLAKARETLDKIKKDLPQEQPPIAFKKAWITKNAINNPEARITYQNTSTKSIDAVRIFIFCFDNFGNPTSTTGDNKFSALKQDTISPNETIDGNKAGWTLYLHENTTKFTAVLAQIHFTDGSTWEPDNNPVMKIESK